MSASMVLRRSLRASMAAAFFLCCIALGGSRASAQNQVEAGVKGTIGLGLLGAELGFVIPTAFDYDETWSLITFPIVGAAGGAVGGYYLDRAGSPAASVSMLVLGLSFVVPTVMLTVNATRYSTEDLEDDTARGRFDPRLLAGDGMLRRYGGRWHVEAPGLSVMPVQRVTADARIESAGAELRLTLVSGLF